MSPEPTSRTGRIFNALKNGQEPKDRLWSAIFVLIALVVIVGVLTVVYSRSMRDYLEDGRQIGYQRGAVDCLTLTVDNDRTFDLPPYCQRPEIVLYYPSEVCEEFFSHADNCGDREGG